MLEALLGYPAMLHRFIPHPVAWAGGALSGLEWRWNRTQFSARYRRALGVAALLLVAGSAALAGGLLEWWAGHSAWRGVVIVLLATTGLAQRSLYSHVAAVGRPLRGHNLAAARQAVGQIVGRDVAALSSSGVAGAALESLAESFNDGVVAPAFWLLGFGLPGLFAYKAVNTADSLIGHREPRWREFGWASARLDDALNLIPARLAGALLVLAGRGGWRVMLRDAKKHDSPNAGWPEAAMAGALRIRLGGAVYYDGVAHTRPWFGDGAAPDAADIERGLSLYVVACGFLWAGLALLGLAWRL